MFTRGSLFVVRRDRVADTAIRRYILHHGKHHPRDLGAAEVTQFLADLTVRQHMSASTTNQALSALLFLYRHVVVKDLGRLDDLPRGRPPDRLPVVLTREEVRSVLARLSGVARLVVALLYGAGLRITECLELRVKDVDFARRQITVRRGKGRKDRRAILASAAIRSGTRSRRTCWRTGTTSGRSRSCWGTRM